MNNIKYIGLSVAVTLSLGFSGCGSSGSSGSSSDAPATSSELTNTSSGYNISYVSNNVERDIVANTDAYTSVLVDNSIYIERKTAENTSTGYTSSEAKNYCNTLDYSNGGWRLPTLNEVIIIQSIGTVINYANDYTFYENDGSIYSTWRCTGSEMSCAYQAAPSINKTVCVRDIGVTKDNISESLTEADNMVVKLSSTGQEVADNSAEWSALLYKDSSLNITLAKERTNAGFAQTKTYEDANLYCENLSYIGYDNWRLPRIEEIDVMSYYYADNIDELPSVSNQLWTSTAGSSYHWTYYLSSSQHHNENDTSLISFICVRDNITPINKVPIANAGANQNVKTTSTVILNGSTSSDADLDQLTYSWSIISKPTGSNASLSSTTVAKPTIVVDLDGSYVMSLIVNDQEVSSTVDTITVVATTANLVPRVNAGVDQNVIAGTSVTLTAIASDSDGSLSSYEWKEGTTVLSTNFSFVKSNFSEGAHTITLTVTDDDGASTTDTVIITLVYFERDNNFLIDYSANLLWQDDDSISLNEMNWDSATKYCEDLVLNNYTSWRLPEYYEVNNRLFDLKNNFQNFNHKHSDYTLIRYDYEFDKDLLSIDDVYWLSTTSDYDSSNSNDAKLTYVFSGDNSVGTGSFDIDSIMSVRCVHER